MTDALHMSTDAAWAARSREQHPWAEREDPDAIVIGGGPGGAAAAWRLAHGGARVLLVERASYPREKACGDGLTPRAVASLQRLGMGPEIAGWARNRGLRVHGGGRAFELPWPDLASFPSYGVARPRAALDEAIARHAAAAGAVVWDHSEAKAPLVENGVVTGAMIRYRDTEELRAVRAPVIVAADGAAARFAQALGSVRDPRRPIGVAARAYYPSPRADEEWLDSYLEVRDEHRLLPGYGWVFPLGGGLVNVGLGVLDGASGSDQRGSFRSLLAAWTPVVGREWGFGPEDLVGVVRSAPLPMAASRHPVLHRGVMLVGDAAGLVNPFNGEGIDYALEAGELAGSAGLRLLETGDRTALSAYRWELERRLSSYHTLGRVFVRIVNTDGVMAALVRYGLPHPQLMRLVLKLMANLYDPSGGDLADRVVRTLVAIAPAR